MAAPLTSGQWCPSWMVPDNPYFISCRVMGSISPEVSTCQTVTSQTPHKENEFVDVCQNPHILLFLSFYFSFYFTDFFPWPPSQDLSRSSCEITKRKKAQQRRCWIRCIREWATSDTLHPFCIIQAFSYTLSLNVVLHQISCVLSAMPL